MEVQCFDCCEPRLGEIYSWMSVPVKSRAHGATEDLEMMMDGRQGTTSDVKSELISSQTGCGRPCKGM